MRHLIVNADDFGASTGVNRGIFESHVRGIVTSTSFMVTGRAAAEAVSLSREHPGLSVGLHWDVWGEDERTFDLDDESAVRDEFDRQLAAFHECGLPTLDGFRFRPTRQPVVVDLWQAEAVGAADTFTTIGNWRQPYKEVELDGETYYWSKHLEFLKFVDLPGRTGQSFELALSSYDADDQALLESNGWVVTQASALSADPDVYRHYIAGSRAEFTVAKDQNVRLRTGWVGDRSPTYLAAGRPVILQDTGFGNHLPTGEGLFSFSTMDDILAAVECINGDYERHSRAATEIAREYFSYDVVLPRLLT